MLEPILLFIFMYEPAAIELAIFQANTTFSLSNAQIQLREYQVLLSIHFDPAIQFSLEHLAFCVRIILRDRVQ